MLIYSNNIYIILMYVHPELHIYFYRSQISSWLNLHYTRYTISSRFCDSQNTDCLTSRSDLSIRFGCYIYVHKGGIHYLQLRTPPKQPNKIYKPPCTSRLRARWFALPNRREGKTFVSFHHPLFPASKYVVCSCMSCIYVM